MLLIFWLHGICWKRFIIWSKLRSLLLLLHVTEMSVRLAFTDFANSDGSDVHLMDLETWNYSHIVSGYVGPRFCDVTCGLLQRHSCWGIQVYHRQAPASTECCRSSLQRHTEVRSRTQPSGAWRAALAGVPQQVRYKLSAAQSTTVYDGLLHPHLKHCSSAASAVCRLPSAVRTATLAFNVRSLSFFCSWPGGLELVTRLPARSVTFLWQFLPGPENFSRFTTVHSALEALWLCTI